MASAVTKKLIVSPVLFAYLHEAKYPPRFTVTFRNLETHRSPDGWFHPSTHPLMSERQLYYYLAEPDRWEQEVLTYESRMSVTMGSAVHDFVQMCLIDAGVLVEPTGTCVNCGREHGKKKNQCDEHGAVDRELGSRGHMDGMLALDTNPQIPGYGGFEFKTSNPRTLGAIEDNDIEAFKKKWPEYYAQVQEYMRMTGFTYFIVLVLSLGYPWIPREFVVPYDVIFAAKTEAKYRRVREAVATGTLPEPCCGPRTKESRACPALLCPIKVM